MSAHDEIIALVDKNNTVIGEVPRRLMRFGVDIHRVSYILVFNQKGNLLVQKRTDDKAFCPGYFGVTTGGVVESGESYIDSAHRELQEELGFDAPLTSHGVFYTEGEGYRIWGKVYSCLYKEDEHGPLALQAREVASIHEMSRKEILENPQGRLFMPDSLDAFYHYTNNLIAAQADDPL